MTPERYGQIGELYHAALELPPGERGSFLAAACGSDDELRRQVETLLARAGSETGTVLGRPAIHVAAEMLSQQEPGAMIGFRLRSYELEGLIGVGGMGQVYRARDTRLGREVAVKILPPAFKEHPERIARFEREAQLLASLNHPHIGAIYGLEEADGVKALVMELVEGDDLSERLARAPIPIDEALTIARQIAEALEAAHEQGIVHRDLKPANVKVRSDGTVKVLDFGLAKALAVDDTEALTLAKMSHPGAIMGTPAYMSPEQARGEAVGREADIWSFGVVLYELLTGISPFLRATTSETLASVLGPSPDYSRLPDDTPPQIRRLVHRCLERDRKRRMRHIGDARIEIEEALTDRAIEPTRPPAPPSADRRRVRQAAVALAVVAVAAFAGWWFASRAAPRGSSEVVRLAIPFPEPPRRGVHGQQHLAIAADGSTVAFASGSRLWIRRIGDNSPTVIDVRASNPFFSPDGEWVAFFGWNHAQGLKKVAVRGGVTVPLVDTADRPLGGAWRADGTIVFATSEGIYQVSENGGEPQLLVRPDPRRRERYGWPHFMPDGQSVLFTVVRGESIERAQIVLFDFSTRQITTIIDGGNAARYVSTGHLVYASGQTLNAIRFDLAARRTYGTPVAFRDITVANAPDSGAAAFAVSDTGTLVYIAPETFAEPLRTLLWVDRQGKEEALPIAPGPYAYARISPDGSRVALDIRGAANRDIWIWNAERPTLTKVTSGPTEDMLPVWSRDGRRLYFASDRAGNFDVYSQTPDGATTERVEFTGPGFQAPLSVTPDGTRLLVIENFRDVGVFHVAKPHHLERLLYSNYTEQLAEVSPDGRWIAYESDEAGNQMEIFLRPLSDISSRREKVSIDGGRYPLWGPAGTNELFYVDLKGMMRRASITLSPSLELGRVTPLFQWEAPPRGVSGREYDISPIDGRFLMVKRVAAQRGGPFHVAVVLNWFDELRQRMSSDTR